MKNYKLGIRPVAAISALALTLLATGCVCSSSPRAHAPYPVAASDRYDNGDRDDDGDGVMNDMDKCPSTPKGFHVNRDGCIIEQTVILRTVNFEYKSDHLTRPAEESLDEVATALISQPSLNVQVAGHTDSIGSAGYNLKLSDRRAKSVRQYLISRGVAAKNLQAAGFGESKPIASNETADGRTENRRVEFAIVDKPAHLNVMRAESSKKSKNAAKRK
jgi:OOP family OmpA-OmpF porin